MRLNDCSGGNEDGVGFDCDEGLGVDEAAHFDQSCGRTDSVEELRVRPAHLLPILDVRKEDARPHDILESRARLSERRLDLAEDVEGLAVRVSGKDDLPLRIRCGGAGDRHVRPHTDGPRVSYDRLPTRPGRDVLPLHGTAESAAAEKASPRHDAFPDFTSGGGTFGRRGGTEGSGGSQDVASFSAARSPTPGASSPVPSRRPIPSSKTLQAWVSLPPS